MACRRIICFLALSHLLGCGAATEPSDPADNRGTHVGSFARVEDLTWSTDGTELYFRTGGNQIVVVPAAGGTARTLYSSTALAPIGFITAVANKLYTSVPVNQTPTWYRILGIDPSNGSITTLLDYGGRVFSIRTSILAVSNDERFVAFGDSLFDRVSATKRPLSLGHAWGFSADGSQLLYELNAPSLAMEGGFAILNTLDGSTFTGIGPGDIAGRTTRSVGAHYWEGNEPSFLRVVEPTGQKRVEVSVAGARTGAERDLATIEGEVGTSSREGALSADGKRAAVWVGPLGRWVQLHVIDTETLTRTVPVTVSGGLGPLVDGIVFSPDGSRVAYFVWEDGTSPTSGFAKVYVAPTF